MYQPAIDNDILIADFAPTFESLDDRIFAAVNSLAEINSLPDAVSDEDAEVSRKIFGKNHKPTEEDLARPGVVSHLAALLSEYDKIVIKSAAQLRTYITNRLILESDNADPRIRLKSLEMLGKISDVGLFTDKTEITMRHRPTAELEQLLRERLTKVIEAEAVDTPRVVQPIQLDLNEITDAEPR